MKRHLTTLRSVSLLALLTSFLSSPLVAAATVTPPQTSREARVEFQTAAVMPPQDDREERRRYEEQLKTKIEVVKDLQAELIEARKDRIEAQRQEEKMLKEARQDRVETLRREQLQHQKERAERILDTQKELLMKVVETLVLYAERLKARAELMVNPELKSSLVEKANQFLALAHTLQSRIVASTAIEQLQPITVELKNLRNQMAVSQKEDGSVHSLIVLGYIDRFEHSFVAKAEARVKAMQDVVERLEKNGKNVDTARVLLEAANQRLAEIRADLSVMKQRATSAERLSGADFASIRVSLNGVKNELKTVYETLLEITKHLK